MYGTVASSRRGVEAVTGYDGRIDATTHWLYYWSLGGSTTGSISRACDATLTVVGGGGWGGAPSGHGGAGAGGFYTESLRLFAGTCSVDVGRGFTAPSTYSEDTVFGITARNGKSLEVTCSAGRAWGESGQWWKVTHEPGEAYIGTTGYGNPAGSDSTGSGGGGGGANSAGSNAPNSQDGGNGGNGRTISGYSVALAAGGGGGAASTSPGYTGGVGGSSGVGGHGYGNGYATGLNANGLSYGSGGGGTSIGTRGNGASGRVFLYVSKEE